MAGQKEKSIPLAIGLNIILPGLGYMYMGKVVVGIGAMLLVVLILISTPLITLFFVWVGINVIMAIDMFVLGNKLKKEIAEQTTKKCPKCAEIIKKEAKVCRFCGESFSE